MTIAVFGATGALGQHVLTALHQRGVAPDSVLALGRDAEKLARIAAQGFATQAVDYDRPETLSSVLTGVQRVLLISSPDAGRRVPQHTNVIEAAAAAGVEFLAYTSLLSADTSPLSLAPDHKATEAVLASAGIPYTLLRNGWYTENYQDLFHQAAETGQIRNSAGSGRVGSALRAEYALAAAVVMTTDGHAGKTYELSGTSQWTFDEFAAAATKVLGKSIEYVSLTPQEELAELTSSWIPAPVAEFIVTTNQHIAAGHLAGTTDHLVELIGKNTASLNEVFSDWIAR